MGKIKVACETYTWQMPGESYKGKLDHIMGIVSKAGFAGIEPETSFFGDLADPLNPPLQKRAPPSVDAPMCCQGLWGSFHGRVGG